MERIMNSLPDAVMTVLQLGTSFLLSEYSAEDVMTSFFLLDLSKSQNHTESTII